MDAKITKQRLSRMLSYDWIKIVGVIVAICIVWSLVFTMTATQITSTQKFYIYNYVGNHTFSEKFLALYDKASYGSEKVFSYEILESNYENLGKEVNTVLEARFSIGEGDLMFVANAPNKDDSYTVGEGDEAKTYYRNYTETFARTRSRFLYALEGENNYFAQMEEYLSLYFNGDWETGELNKEKAKADFRKRVKKDKRFKSEAQLLQGEIAEFARLESYREALGEFYYYLNDLKIVKFETVTLQISETETREFTCYLNLNPSKEKIDEVTGEVVRDDKGYPLYDETVKDNALNDYLSYDAEVVNDKGETNKQMTSRNMCVGFLDMSSLEGDYRVEEGFQGECLLFINLLIREVHNFTK